MSHIGLDIRPMNKKGERHGFWQIHFQDGSLMHMGDYINDRPVGLWINNYLLPEWDTKTYYI